MEKILLEIPDEVLISLKETPSEFSRDLLMLAAVKLYRMGKLSSGQAAQLAGIPRVIFLQSIEGLKITYPSGFENAVHMTTTEMEQHIRLMAALKMFELGKVSSGKAAQLAGMSRIEFYETCGRYRVSIFNYPPEELEQEIKKDLETARKLSGK